MIVDPLYIPPPSGLEHSLSQPNNLNHQKLHFQGCFDDFVNSSTIIRSTIDIPNFIWIAIA